MAGSKSNYMEDKVLNVLRNTTFTGLATVYMALFTAMADAEANSVTEVSGNAYARTAITFGAPSGGSMSNSADCTFPTPTGSWGTIVGWGIYDASSAGNLLYWSDQTPNKTINSGDTVKFATGDVTISET